MDAAALRTPSPNSPTASSDPDTSSTGRSFGAFPRPSAATAFEIRLSRSLQADSEKLNEHQGSAALLPRTSGSRETQRPGMSGSSNRESKVPGSPSPPGPGWPVPWRTAPSQSAPRLARNTRTTNDPMLWPRRKWGTSGCISETLSNTRPRSSTRRSSPSFSAMNPRLSGEVPPCPRWSCPTTAMPRPFMCRASSEYSMTCSTMPCAIWSTATGSSTAHSAQWRLAPFLEEGTLNSRNPALMPSNGTRASRLCPCRPRRGWSR